MAQEEENSNRKRKQQKVRATQKTPVAKKAKTRHATIDTTSLKQLRNKANAAAIVSKIAAIAKTDIRKKIFRGTAREIFIIVDGTAN